MRHLSDGQIEGLADDLVAEDFYLISQDRDDNGDAYLVIEHENGHSTLISWDCERELFLCDEITAAGEIETCTAASVDEVIAKLNEQARCRSC